MSSCLAGSTCRSRHSCYPESEGRASQLYIWFKGPPNRCPNRWDPLLSPPHPRVDRVRGRRHHGPSTKTTMAANGADGAKEPAGEEALTAGLAKLSTAPSKTAWADVVDGDSPTAETPKEAADSKEMDASAGPARAEESRLREVRDGAREVEVELNEEIRGNDVLYRGMATFEEMGLTPELLKGVYAAGFEAPSKIQEKAIPLLLHNPPQNLIGQSQSGTGKTAAFSLSILSRVDPKVKATQALVLAPSRELARQIYDVIKELGKFTSVDIALIVRDSYDRDGKIDAQVVVGTPGTVIDVVRKRTLNVQKVRFFCLDEADNMLDQQGLGDQSLSVDGIKQLYMNCTDEAHKFETLVNLYGLLTIGQSIIFVSRRDVADRIAKEMTEQGHKVISLHGGFDAAERDSVMDAFRSGKAKVLITTNVLARGIDILMVNVVINYDMPTDAQGRPDPETYLHRIGRTGRFGRKGISINFVHDRRSREQMRYMEDYFQRPITEVDASSLEHIEEMLKKFMS
ncbi:P-loop containing nucleoside triphosphate hydrolase protein [Hyaloraphidium curvatum]|nr:P-loop containing nucleoside triphosphate hydrolase protein [Hyaloraphidium curvatum]